MQKPSLSDSSDSAQIGAIADQCVKCGLCLPACPTYQSQHSESESPRGRIAIAAAIAAGSAIDSSARQHLDSCLGCGACERVCPSRVRYLDLLAATRARMHAYRRESAMRRLLRGVLERPIFMKWMAPFALRVHPAMRRLPRRRSPSAAASSTTAMNAAGPLIGILSGCSGTQLEASALAAAVSLLDRCGLRQILLPAQCCGALAYHSGDLRRADHLGQRLRAQLHSAGVDACTGIVSGCGRHCTQLLSGQAPYENVMNLLWARRDRLRFRSTNETVALHTPCSERPGEDGRNPAERLLALVPGLKLVVLPSRGRCCGSAGTHFVDHPIAASQLAEQTGRDLAVGRADIVLTSNIGCRVQLLRGQPKVQHPVEFLYAQLESPP